VKPDLVGREKVSRGTLFQWKTIWNPNVKI